VRIVVTRPRGQAGTDELASRLRALGHDVSLCPLIAVEPVGPPTIDVSRYDWVIVTSGNAARELAARRRGRIRRLAAVGPGTAAELRAHRLEPDLVPTVSSQEGLLAELPRPAGRALFAGAEGARRLLADELGADFVALYRTIELRPPDFPSADLVILASGSAARAYSALGERAPAVSIGPQTTLAARKGGVTVLAEASTHDLDGLVGAVASLAERERA
jgi:uroporphyrinogen-III synthase